jgi:hypothetical protein
MPAWCAILDTGEWRAPAGTVHNSAYCMRAWFGGEVGGWVGGWGTTGLPASRVPGPKPSLSWNNLAGQTSTQPQREVLSRLAPTSQGSECACYRMQPKELVRPAFPFPFPTFREGDRWIKSLTIPSTLALLQGLSQHQRVFHSVCRHWVAIRPARGGYPHGDCRRLPDGGGPATNFIALPGQIPMDQ